MLTKYNGFGDIFDQFDYDNSLLASKEKSNYRLIKTEKGKRIQIPVAGYPRENLNVYKDNNGLVVEGKEEKKIDNIERKGYEVKQFKTTFIIDKFDVSDIKLKDGLLIIDLTRTKPDRHEFEIKVDHEQIPE